jgi:two-component system NtrC family sensor kinase
MHKVLQLLGDDSPFGLILLDQDGTVRHMNERMQAWAGRDISQWMEKGLLALLGDATAADWNPAGTYAAPLHAGQRRFHCLLCLPFHDPTEGPGHVLVFYEEDETEGLRLGFSLMMKHLEKIELEQQRLVEELERTNNHLLHAEKMAGIGQLAAGVAHEINNPIGYVFSNLKTLAGYMHDMLRIIDAADEVSNIDELRALKRTLDYNYIRNDVEALIEESEDGIGRVKKIINALKDFSHIDEDGFRESDLHRAIDATLNIVNNEIKYKAQIVKCYGILPLVECDISQINQVILNLVMNAAQALQEFGAITVRTGHEGEWVWIDIEDTGRGMEPSVMERIFDPFFTTKPMGQGTGLGLSLSFSIVQKHRGRIDVKSNPGTGTCFRVWLPVKPGVAGKVPSCTGGNK